MQDILNSLLQRLQQLQDLVLPTLYWFRARVGIETATTAVIAAGGMLILLLGLFSTKRVNLLGEAAHLEGVREPGPLERLQTQLYQSGIRIKVHEFLAVGVMLGAALGGLFILLGFVSIGVAFGLSGPFIYYQYLMGRRIKEMRLFRDELPIAILDTRDHLTMRANDLRGAMLEMAERGPKSLRIDFDYAFRLMSSGADSEPLALREVSRKREEPFFRQFFDALANHHKGGDTAAVLTRIAQGQKTHNRLQAKTRAKQSGLRLVGMLYLVAPPLFAVFMALSGGPEAAAFYASLDGQLVQLVAVLSGILSYWLSGKIAMRGLYMDEVTRVRLDTEQVPAYVTSDEFGGALADEPFVPTNEVLGAPSANGASASTATATAVTSHNGNTLNGLNGPNGSSSPNTSNGKTDHGSTSVGGTVYDLVPEDDEEANDTPSVEALLAFQNLDLDALFDEPLQEKGDATSNNTPDPTRTSATAKPWIGPPSGPDKPTEVDDMADDDEDLGEEDGDEEVDGSEPTIPQAHRQWMRPVSSSNLPNKLGATQPDTAEPTAHAPIDPPPAQTPLYARKRPKSNPGQSG
jgi:Flp pilus assembly protein TadB